MDITLVIYSHDNVYQGETKYPTMTGTTIEDFFKRNSLDASQYVVTVNGHRPLNTFRLYEKMIVKLVALSD